jgi:hypothetical protein
VHFGPAALHSWSSCQHDHWLAGLIFRSRSDLIAGQIEGEAVALIGECKMQRLPSQQRPSGPHAEKNAEIDHGGPYLPPVIDQDVDPRHPRALARIPPTQLGLWSFAVAVAHGAGFMLVPIYLGLCRAADLDGGHQAAGALISGNLGMAALVSLVHGAAMIAAGGVLA